MTEYLCIGKIITTHGVNGEIKVYSYTDNIKRYDILKKTIISQSEKDEDIGSDLQYEVTGVKYIKNNPIVKLKGIDSIDDARKYIGYYLYVNRNDAVKLAEDEYYIADILGLKCIAKNEMIGTVYDVLKTKSGSILSIKDENDKEILIPMVSEFIKKVDLEQKTIYIELIEGFI